MKKTILTNLKYIAFGLVLAFAASYANASWGSPVGGYAGPTSSFPNNNADAPINVSGTGQVKIGGLSLGGWFNALANAEINGPAVFHGTLRGGTPADVSSTLSVGGSGPVTHMDIKGGFRDTSFVRSVPLSNPDGLQVCADASGFLVLCDVVVVPPPPVDPGNGGGGGNPPAPQPAYINFMMDWNQHGSSVTISNASTGERYYLYSTSFYGQNYSADTSVPAGTYYVESADVYCDNGVQVYPDPYYWQYFDVGEGQTYTIRLQCGI